MHADGGAGRVGRPVNVIPEAAGIVGDQFQDRSALALEGHLCGHTISADSGWQRFYVKDECAAVAGGVAIPSYTAIATLDDRLSERTRESRSDRTRYNRRVHFVYIVRCADGTLYTGYARDPRARERAHNSGRGAKYTAGRRPVRLVYQEEFRSMGKALAREYVVKQLTRVQKDALVVSAR